MEAVLNELDVNTSEKALSALKKFNAKNFKNFSLGESAEVRERFCSSLLELLPIEEGAVAIPVKLQIEAIISLRIVSREQYGNTKLTSSQSLKKLLKFTGLDIDVKSTLSQITSDNSGLSMQVAIESLKCVGNIVLKKESSACACGELGAHKAILERMKLWQTETVPYDLKFFDMRLLFILTAVDTKIRGTIHGELNGFHKVVCAIDYLMFGGAEQPSQPSGSDAATLVPQLVCRVAVYAANISNDSAALLSEMLKTIFNITLNWCDKEDINKEQMLVFKCFTHLLRVLFVSIHPHRGTNELKLISHCIDALMNVPVSCSGCLLLPAQVKVDELIQHQIDPNMQLLYSEKLDKVYTDYNMAVFVSLLNFVCAKLSLGEESSALMPVMAVLRINAAGNRTVRKFLRQELLPPLGRVESRPDFGNSLKSRLVKLMTAAGGSIGSVVADLFFILCKENPKRLVKHTGYGNAAGLLMSRGMLGGVAQPKEYNYSEDEDSDTEEYLQSRIDPVTGGPAPLPEPSPLDSMTEEAKEAEAEKLMGLIDQLNRQGIMRMVPMDKQGNPVSEKDKESDDQ